MLALRGCRRLRALPRLRLLEAPTRSYAFSRFPDRGPGVGRKRDTPRKVSREQEEFERFFSDPLRQREEPKDDEPRPTLSWGERERMQAVNPEESLRTILSNPMLVVTRQIEMLNIFVGFEQANRYVISNEEGETLGFIAEEPRGFFSTFSRQIFKTHRPFRALIMDSQGAPLLWVRRPFAWINSRMFVQRLQNYSDYTPEGEPILDTFGEVQQRWHLWRRRYDVFLRESTRPILSTVSEPQPEPSETEETFTQLAKIDEGFWAWNFSLRDHRDEEFASIRRAFRGFGREIFTDTGQYFIRFHPDPTEEEIAARGYKPIIERNLSMDERALILATAVTIDFDYFSRHSTGGPGMFWFLVASSEI
ncbi:Scramblase-domain-containing protein [Gloeophyllum trabeum ATCC 11539]|uniref:Phospholipid scramblase n=1 Tax=Gloeophyllum trabeum (strain ATCC 11539 / FP-39264 / Madison 617) TaxID=670483 RepID=S7QEX6_GLOTA|nr:Scramblase-domain-containing protein [Gloeophyllum trabeum ATCC 11539]EPQ58376.1 Scramblase-domain-containing protein [Gloeophyllum trabeum ATCC 11539]